ncbi:MAG: LacI family transcriptional regulator, partial [Candidatus Thiodiazotropha sp. (ex Dulcina madagascariensis)]|nr:LacI family transcriptional regulator [Candidatus Thiodiazotropha sp. (ex Dulcina madagascariensis)]
MVLSKHGIDPKSIPSVGIDYIRSAREAIRRGEQSASFTYPTGGAEGARMALKILKGEAVPKEIVLESTMVTKDNVDQVEPIF